MAGLTRRSFGLLAPGIMGLGVMSVASAADDRFFDSAGVRIHYVEQGTGEPVFLIYGYTVNLNEQWIATGVFPALASSYRVIALDARGHGLSEKLHERSAYGPEMGLDIIRLLDHLGIRRAHIVGYSMGAHIVAQLVTTHPDRFITLTLGGASGRRNWSGDDQHRVDVEFAEMDEGMLRSLESCASGPRISRRHPMKSSGNALLSAWQAKTPRRLPQYDARTQTKSSLKRRCAPSPYLPLELLAPPIPIYENSNSLSPRCRKLQLVTIEGASHGSAPGRPEFSRAFKSSSRRILLALEGSLVVLLHHRREAHHVGGQDRGGGGGWSLGQTR